MYFFLKKLPLPGNLPHHPADAPDSPPGDLISGTFS
jgi:hypothetical protein